MSYILEALKKSSDERARLTGVATERAPAPRGRETRSFVPPWWWIAGIGLGGVAVIAFVASATDTPEPEPDRSPSRPPISASAATSAQAPIPLDEPPVAPSVTTKPAPLKRPATVNLANLAALETPPKAPPESTAKPPSPTLPITTEKVPPPAPLPNSSTEMPPDLLRQVLAIPVSAHIYSGKPAERMVIIDGRAVREGDQLPSGVSIEQITPTGITVSYKGYRANKPIH